VEVTGGYESHLARSSSLHNMLIPVISVIAQRAYSCTA
jgi:hypothetical protein